MDYLLHPNNFMRMTFTGKRISKWMQARATQVAEAATGLHDPDVSIVICTRNDGEHIKRAAEVVPHTDKEKVN